jgi:hypothetical protein
VATALSSLAMRLDPVQMARAAGIEPDPWQCKLLRSQAQRIFLNCSRQSGKSTVAAALAMHTAIYEPGAPILLLSPSLRQSQELFRKCLDVYRALDRPVAPEAESALRLELESGSRIISLPGKEATVRSFSGVRLLIIDEASRVEDVLYMAVRPMLAVSHGRLLLLSSPFGDRGFYHEAYKHREDWDYYEVPAEECPRITPEFLEEEKETYGEWWFEQEYHCKFMSAAGAAFRAEDIERIMQRDIETWDL